MYEQRKKPQKIAWTQAWRRLHKKNVDNRQKKKVSDTFIRGTLHNYTIIGTNT